VGTGEKTPKTRVGFPIVKRKEEERSEIREHDNSV